MKLHYKSYGEGDPVIILHGLFGLGDNWRTIARMLESQYQVLLPDLRNHGRSPHEEEMSFDIMASDVRELLDDLDIEDAHLIGHSMGGKVSMQLATTYPERVTKLVVVDIAPKVYPPHHASVIRAIQSLNPESATSRDALETKLREHIQDDEATVQFLMKNLTRLPEGGFQWKANMPSIIASYDRLMEDIQYLHPYLGETLFVRGERSRYILDEDFTALLPVFPKAKLSTIPEAGHWVHADQPTAFFEVIHNFLRH